MQTVSQTQGKAPGEHAVFVLLRVYFKKRVSKVLNENCIESWS